MSEWEILVENLSYVSCDTECDEMLYKISLEDFQNLESNYGNLRFFIERCSAHIMRNIWNGFPSDPKIAKYLTQKYIHFTGISYSSLLTRAYHRGDDNLDYWIEFKVCQIFCERRYLDN